MFSHSEETRISNTEPESATGLDTARGILLQLKDIFHDAPPEFPPPRGIGHIIPTGESQPVHRHMYKMSMSPREKECAEKMITELLEKGRIRPSSSLYSSTVRTESSHCSEERWLIQNVC